MTLYRPQARSAFRFICLCVLAFGASRAAGSSPTLVAGARGDGKTDNRRALQLAIDEASRRTGGGTVLLEAGTYRISGYLTLRSHVHVQGAGAHLTTIALDYDGPTRAITTTSGAHDFGMRDLAVTGLPHVPNQTLIYIAGAERAHLANINLTHASFAGLFITGSSDVTATDIHVSNIDQTFGASGVTGGTGIWIFRGNSRVTLTRVAIEDVAVSGLVIDAGSNDGVAAQNADITVTDVTVQRFATRNHDAGGTGINLQGCERCTVSRFRIAEGNPNHLSYGVFLSQDQSGVECVTNTITNGSIRDVSGPAIRLSGASHNSLSGITISSYGTLRSPAPSAAIEFSDPPWVLAGRTTHATLDNILADVTIDPGARGHNAGAPEYAVAWKATRSTIRGNLVIATLAPAASRCYERTPVSQDPALGRANLLVRVGATSPAKCDAGRH